MLVFLVVPPWNHCNLLYHVHTVTLKVSHIVIYQVTVVTAFISSQEPSTLRYRNVSSHNGRNSNCSISRNISIGEPRSYCFYHATCLRFYVPVELWFFYGWCADECISTKLRKRVKQIL